MTKDNDTSRRDFLKIAGTVAPAAAVLTAAGGAQAEPLEADLLSEKMQDTAHTRAYLDSARF
jgi:hypothetical protein